MIWHRNARMLAGECRDRTMSRTSQPDRPGMRRKHVTVQRKAPVAFWDGWKVGGERGAGDGVEPCDVGARGGVCSVAAAPCAMCALCVWDVNLEVFSPAWDKHNWKHLSPIQLGCASTVSVLGVCWSSFFSPPRNVKLQAALAGLSYCGRCSSANDRP